MLITILYALVKHYNFDEQILRQHGLKNSFEVNEEKKKRLGERIK